MSTDFLVSDYPVIVQPWGLLGIMGKLDLRPMLVAWLDQNVRDWRIEYRSNSPLAAKPVLVIDDDREADDFRHAWLAN